MHNRSASFAVAAFGIGLAASAFCMSRTPALAKDGEIVKTGFALRGTNKDYCSFDSASGDNYDANGILTNASIQCGSSSQSELLKGLPRTFQRFCIVSIEKLKPAQIQQNPEKENDLHCIISGIKASVAQGAFGMSRAR